jgi:hypothetical protein
MRRFERHIWEVKNLRALLQWEYWNDGEIFTPSTFSGHVHKVRERNKKIIFSTLTTHCSSTPTLHESGLNALTLRVV